MTSPQRGYAFALAAYTIFTLQDAVSKHLGELYSPLFIAMVRYWVFAVVVLALAHVRLGGIRKTAFTRRPVLQLSRGVLLATQIVTGIISFASVGMSHSQAIFAATPLVIMALSIPVLGEHVGWRRWLAILAGMIGVLIILDPAAGRFDARLIVPLINVGQMAAYAVMTRLANREDGPMTSFFYNGIGGALAMTAVGPFFWTTLAPADYGWLALLCVSGMVSHFCLIKAYQHLAAVQVQPVAYFQLVFGSFLGVVLFGEVLGLNIVAGSALVVAAGLFSIWREARLMRQKHLQAV